MHIKNANGIIQSMRYINPIIEIEKHQQMLCQYINLTRKSELSDSEMKRLAEIWEEAQSDDVLSLLITEIEEWALQHSGFIDRELRVDSDSFPVTSNLEQLLGQLYVSGDDDIFASEDDRLDQKSERNYYNDAVFVIHGVTGCIPDLDRESFHSITEKQKSLIREYARLTNQAELSNSEMNRMAEIWEEAQSDDVLSLLITEIEEWALQHSGFIDRELRIDSDSFPVISGCKITLDGIIDSGICNSSPATVSPDNERHFTDARGEVRNEGSSLAAALSQAFKEFDNIIIVDSSERVDDDLADAAAQMMEVISKIKEANQKLSYRQIVNILKDTAADLGSL
jgi:hypothetical protein